MEGYEGYKCHWCQYRYGGCPHNKWVPYCKEFRIGGCYSCKYYYGKNGKLDETEVEQWYKRGCETFFPSSLYSNPIVLFFKFTLSLDMNTFSLIY